MNLMGKKRIAVIDYEKCNPEACGGYACQRACPVNRNGKECITHELNEKPKISEELCIGCVICEHKCPFGAISIINLSIDFGKELHSFGENQFRLYGLASPREKSVLGLIGRNGIGKTTLVKILSGSLIPNFGEKKGSIAQVIEHYKGKEVQAFFKQLYAGYRIAIKPQHIEGIKVTGTVRQLLEKIAPRDKVEAIAEKLNITTILERDAEKLSGGEFQKIAIAATGLKDADLYFFDEPTSFLDIRERLRVAHFIKELSERASVLVVEHDLILLDFLSDYVHLMYGKPKVYGSISQIKTTREGINDYLEGYSREENYKFRDYSINFFSANREHKDSKQTMIRWPALTKKLGNFNLTTEANSVRRNEVIGVVGPNGIGKTTFMKILAGELKPDNTTLDERAKISYKPQYISYEGNKTVRELFDGGVIEDIKMSLLRPLELEELLEKPAKTLSGGELQRVSIALCLSKKAQIYLLDEPSAYLDVEQRLAVGKVIKGHIDMNDCAALIIDHDLTFVDFVSDKIMVFSGEPTLSGHAEGPFDVRDGMNQLLKYLDITVRRDKDSKRPRINKHGSVLDREQKQSQNYYS